MDRTVWKNPKKSKSLDQSQTPLWFWNDLLEDEELKRQLKMKTDIGVTCTIPHARTNMGEGYIGGYLDDEWFSHIQTVLDYKKNHEEPVWLYDEIDWPAGTCNQTITKDENLREQYLQIDEIRIPAGESFRTQLRELNGKTFYFANEDTDYTQFSFNVFIVEEETGKLLNLSDYFIFEMFGPELEFKYHKNAIAYVIKIHIDAYQLSGNLQVSYINKDATKAFINSTYEKYYERFGNYFGTIIKTIFNDETRMCHALPWGFDIREAFMIQKGYDIMPYLYQLIRTGNEAGRIRCDYFDVLANLYQHNYFKVLADWCHNHNVNLFAHLLGEETLFGHARYSGDYLRQNKYLDCVGADHLGKGIGSLNIKFTSCGAHSYGKQNTAVEVFAGCGWNMTFHEYIRMVTWMFQQGMQCIINHGFFYSDRGNRKNDWPPSQFFQWQGWDQMSQGNDMIRRLSYAFTGGINEAEILIYHPIETFLMHYIPEQQYTVGFFKGAFLNDNHASYLDQEYQKLLNGLLSENMDFDLIHKDAIENFIIENGSITNQLNKQNFSVLILPMCEILPVEMARFCNEFVESGGKIILLDCIPKLAMPKEYDVEVKGIFKSLLSKETCHMISVSDKDSLYSHLRQVISYPVKIVKGTRVTENSQPSYPAYLIDPYVHTGEDISGVMFTRYIKNGKRHTLFMNYSDTPETICVEIDSKEFKPEVYDTFTGDIKEAEIVKEDENSYVIQLDLPCNYGIVLVTQV